MESINRQWLLVKRPTGSFNESNFKYHEADIPKLGQQQVLLKNLYLSCDPSQRIMASLDSYVAKVELGTPMRSFGIGQVIESTHSKFKMGDLVFAFVDWQTHCLLDFNQEFIIPPRVLPGFLDPELALANIITGLTAYFGMLDIGRPKAGQAVLVSGAAGAVGSMAAQIAKLKGCYVVGVCSSDAKGKWLVDTLGLDGFINYKTEQLNEKIKEKFPSGIDIFFDNVGGEILEIAIHNLAKHARVVLSGAISQYEHISSVDDLNHLDIYGIRNTMELIGKNAMIKGFLLTDYRKHFIKGLLTLNHWIDQEKIQCQIDVAQGFENIPDALKRLFTGANKGKQIVKLCEMPLAPNVNRFQKTLWQMLKRVVF